MATRRRPSARVGPSAWYAGSSAAGLIGGRLIGGWLIGDWLMRDWPMRHLDIGREAWPMRHWPPRRWGQVFKSDPGRLGVGHNDQQHEQQRADRQSRQGGAKIAEMPAECSHGHQAQDAACRRRGGHKPADRAREAVANSSAP